MKRLLLCCFLMGCVPEAEPDPLMTETPTATEIAQCHADGGEIVPGGILPWACQTPLIDGGKSCTSGSDCEGFCLAETGQCSAVSPLFGCFAVLEGGQEVTLCVD